jgi:hypothetical protein
MAAPPAASDIDPATANPLLTILQTPCSPTLVGMPLFA